MTAHPTDGVTRRMQDPKPLRSLTTHALPIVFIAVSALLNACGVRPPLHTDAPTNVRLTSGEATYQLIQEPGEGYGQVIGVIDQARRSIRMTMYELADPHATDALIAAHNRGVDTKVILDAAFHGRKTNTAAFDQLSSAGVNVRWAPNGVIYHQKSISIDDSETAVGTANLESKYYSSSRDAWVLDANRDDIAAINATFDADYSAAKDGGGHPPAATPAPNLIWSPAARSNFLQQIDAATRSVDVTTEELKDRPIIVALATAAQRGVTCRIVLTSNPAWAKAIQELTTAGCSIHLIPDDNEHLYMHEKTLLVDGITLIIGSQNLSTASLLENRELSLKLNAEIAKPVLDAVAATFDNDYRQASSG
jgi:phosphatidylserine/phosphatidylglycerophosphate/cardiolipin synthase-like enzyme